MNRVKRVSFVVRVMQDRRGRVRGVIERVATGAKETFTGAEAIGQVITSMLPGEATLPRDSAGSPPPRDQKAGARQASPTRIR